MRQIEEEMERVLSPYLHTIMLMILVLGISGGWATYDIYFLLALFLPYGLLISITHYLYQKHEFGRNWGARWSLKIHNHIFRLHNWKKQSQEPRIPHRLYLGNNKCFRLSRKSLKSCLTNTCFSKVVAINKRSEL